MWPLNYLPAFPVCSVSPQKLFRLVLCAVALFVCAVPATNADATLSYELSGPDAKKTVKKFSVARFFVRIDDPDDGEHYLLFQAGKFFPLYSVDEAQSSYTRLTPAVTPRLGPASRSQPVTKADSGQSDENSGANDHDDHDDDDDDKGKDASRQRSEAQADADESVNSEPETSSSADVASTGLARRSPTPALKSTKKKRTVAGVQCRVVHELLNGKPVIEHCMANSARLGVTERELITLSRLFAMSRAMEFGWLGVSTEDEKFVAVQSRDLRDDRVLQLSSVSTKPLAAGYLRIPRTFKLVESDAEGDSETSGKVEDD